MAALTLTAPAARRTGPEPPITVLDAASSPDLVFFSSASENTLRFVERLDRPAVRVPLRPRLEGRLRVGRPFVLITPSYGGGDPKGAVPRPLATFLNDPANREQLLGVIASGNTNFGEHFCCAGPAIAAKCGVPQLYQFELLGTDRDVELVNRGLARFLAQAQPERTTR